MLTYVLVLLLFSNAALVGRDKSILFSRIVIVSLFLTSFLACTNLYIKPLEKDVEMCGSLLNVSLFTQILILFLLLRATLIVSSISYMSNNKSGLKVVSTYNMLREKILYHTNTIYNYYKSNKITLLTHVMLIIVCIISKWFVRYMLYPVGLKLIAGCIISVINLFQIWAIFSLYNKARKFHLLSRSITSSWLLSSFLCLSINILLGIYSLEFISYYMCTFMFPINNRFNDEYLKARGYFHNCIKIMDKSAAHFDKHKIDALERYSRACSLEKAHVESRISQCDEFKRHYKVDEATTQKLTEGDVDTAAKVRPDIPLEDILGLRRTISDKFNPHSINFMTEKLIARGLADHSNTTILTKNSR